MKVSMKQKNIDFDDLRFLSNIVNIVTNVVSNIDRIWHVKNENFTHFHALILLFGAAIAYECYDCKYEGKDPENLCLRPSEDSGKVSIKSVKSEEDH